MRKIHAPIPCILSFTSRFFFQYATKGEKTRADTYKQKNTRYEIQSYSKVANNAI